MKRLCSVASAAKRGTHVLPACLEDADDPRTVCATGFVFKGSGGLLKSVCSPFESFTVIKHQGDMAREELRA